MSLNLVRICLVAVCLGGLLGCKASPDAASQEVERPWVLTVPIEASPGQSWSLTGTLHARHEIPLAFRVGGEIQVRHVDAGDTAAEGEPLFELDPSDLIQERIAAEASLASARASNENAERERARLADLLARKLSSQQDYDRAATEARAAAEQLTAAEASLEQAVNALEYATLLAPRSGIILDATGQVGQVVSAGQAVATLAEAGQVEAEVYVPEDRRARLPRTAVALARGETEIPAQLRELAGAADPMTQTWRARYRLTAPVDDAPLGSTVTLRFAAGEGATPALQRVPLGAILERADGPMVWRVVEGQVQPEPVEVVRLDGEYAEVRSDLAPGTPVVALGVNRLHAGQAVKARPL